MIYIYCDTCPGHLSASPWQRRRFTCTQSQRTDRSQLRLLRRGLQKLGQHRVWWATTPEGSQLMTLCVFFQKAVDRSARPTSTGHRTHCTQPAGEQDHGARENHYRHVGTFTLLCLSNKHTLRGPFCTITCRVILQPATLVENAGRLLKNHRHPTITVTSLFLFPSPPPPFCFCCMDLPSGGDSSPAMEELLKHLTEISIRQQQIVEHMAARQGETEREVAALRFTTAPRVQPTGPPAFTRLSSCRRWPSTTTSNITWACSRPSPHGKAGHARIGPGFWHRCSPGSHSRPTSHCPWARRTRITSSARRSWPA